MTAPAYSFSAPANVSLTATPITALTALAGASFGLQMTGFVIGALGVTASDVPMLIEVCKWDGVGAGTSTGSATITQEHGEVMVSGMTGFYDYTAEPTALTVMRRIPLTPNGGLIIYDFPLGSEPVVPLGDGFALRITATAAVNIVPGMTVTRV